MALLVVRQDLFQFQSYREETDDQTESLGDENSVEEAIELNLDFF